jgi:hypothetical protein
MAFLRLSDLARDWPAGIRIAWQTRRANSQLHSRATPMQSDSALAPCLVASIGKQSLAASAQSISRVELIAQRWRWDGRPVYQDAAANPPVPGFPFGTLGEISASVQDSLLFSSRSDLDAGVHPARVEFIPSPLNVAQNPVPDSIERHRFPWGGMHGVLCYRIALRAYSRYEGMMNRDSWIDSSTPAAKGEQPQWRRYVKACTWTDRVPKPLVKLVVPLTRPAGSFAGFPVTPGWLVVLDETWYGEAMAGLGEQLCSEVMTVGLPGAGEQRYQFGPDGLLEMPEDPYAGWTLDLPAPVGAIGATFDTDPTAPLFAKTAFLQAPPVLTPPESDPPKKQPEDLSFYFVKMRFWRQIAGFDPAINRETVRSSEKTDAVWAQILPPATHWPVKSGGEITRVSSGDLSFVDGQGFQFGGDAVDILPTATAQTDTKPRAKFEVWVMITRRVGDAFGRAGQEMFHNLVPLADVKTGPPDGVLRLTEIQFQGDRPAGLSLQDLTDRLLGKPGTDPVDALARIVRISPPIGSA